MGRVLGDGDNDRGVFVAGLKNDPVHRGIPFAWRLRRSKNAFRCPKHTHWRKAIGCDTWFDPSGLQVLRSARLDSRLKGGSMAKKIVSADGHMDLFYLPVDTFT